jgi:uncharacterized protein (DUF433 family)
MSRCGEHSRQGQRSLGVQNTRLPVATVFENLEDLSIDEVTEQFDISREEIQAVLQFVARSLELPTISASQLVAVDAHSL